MSDLCKLAISYPILQALRDREADITAWVADTEDAEKPAVCHCYYSHPTHDIALIFSTEMAAALYRLRWF